MQVNRDSQGGDVRLRVCHHVDDDDDDGGWCLTNVEGGQSWSKMPGPFFVPVVGAAKVIK